MMNFSRWLEGVAKIFVLQLALFSVPSWGVAVEENLPFYVDPSCTGSGDGHSWATAKCSVQETMTLIDQQTNSNSALYRRGGVIYLSPGSHTLDSTLQIISPVQLVGAGVGLTTVTGTITVINSQCRTQDGSACPAQVEPTTPRYGSFSRLSNFSLVGSIELNGTEFAEIDNVAISQNGADFAIKTHEDDTYAMSYGYGDWNHVSNVVVTTSGGDALLMENGAGVYMSNSSLRNAVGKELKFKKVSNREGGNLIAVNVEFSQIASTDTLLSFECEAGGAPEVAAKASTCTTSAFFANANTISAAGDQISNHTAGNVWVNHYFDMATSGSCGIRHVANSLSDNISYRRPGSATVVNENDGDWAPYGYAQDSMPIRYHIARATWLGNSAVARDMFDCRNNDLLGDGDDANDANDDTDIYFDIGDLCPSVYSSNTNTDSDGYGNECDPDDDGDHIWDAVDNCTLISNINQENNDSDAQGNVCDADDDNDGTPDASDAFPLDATESVDADNDGTGNNADTDDDADGVLDTVDAFPLDATESVDTDIDGIGNNADTDDDNDGIPDFFLIKVSAGLRHTCALDVGGVHCWGAGMANTGVEPHFGQSIVPALINPVAISAGDFNTCAIDDSGVHCWGDNSYGQNNIPALVNPVAVSVGIYGHTCALDDNGVHCWGGYNAAGELNVPALVNPVAISAGAHHSCALDNSGVNCWGYNAQGQTNVPTLVNPVTVSAGNNFTCALDDSGVHCWGYNAQGQTNVPTLVNPLMVSAGSNAHTCALDDNGVDCWETYNPQGQLTVPILVSPMAVSAGGNHTCAVDASGVHCWGAGVTNTGINPNYGQSLVPTLSQGDNCPLVANTNQINTDGDAQGDTCDTDDDNDGVFDIEEPILGTDPLNANTDNDRISVAGSEAECGTLAEVEYPLDDGFETYFYTAGYAFLHPAIADTDSDGINDLDELREDVDGTFICGIGTYYNDPDSDKDGWCDGDGSGCVGLQLNDPDPVPLPSP